MASINGCAKMKQTGQTVCEKETVVIGSTPQYCTTKNLNIRLNRLKNSDNCQNTTEFSIT
jgi:hypothetical protein